MWSPGDVPRDGKEGHERHDRSGGVGDVGEGHRERSFEPSMPRMNPRQRPANKANNVTRVPVGRLASTGTRPVSHHPTPPPNVKPVPTPRTPPPHHPPYHHTRKIHTPRQEGHHLPAPSTHPGPHIASVRDLSHSPQLYRRADSSQRILNPLAFDTPFTVQKPAFCCSNLGGGIPSPRLNLLRGLPGVVLGIESICPGDGGWIPHTHALCLIGHTSHCVAVVVNFLPVVQGVLRVAGIGQRVGLKHW